MPLTLLRAPFRTYRGKVGAEGRAISLARGSRSIAKKWARPRYPPTAAQLQRRSVHAAIAALWPAVPPANNAAWLALASHYPFVDRSGRTRTRTAQEQFIRSNWLRAFNGDSYISVAPTWSVQSTNHHLFAVGFTNFPSPGNYFLFTPSAENRRITIYVSLPVPQARPAISENELFLLFGPLNLNAPAVSNASGNIVNAAPPDIQHIIPSGAWTFLRTFIRLGAGYEAQVENFKIKCNP